MVYLVPQLNKYTKKDGTVAEHGPYFWVCKNEWTPTGPKRIKLQYLGKHPPPELLTEYTTTTKEAFTCFGHFLDTPQCQCCDHATFCQWKAQSIPSLESMGAEL